MPKQFDATTKFLIQSHPLDWIRFSGLPPAVRVKLVDSDLSTVTFASDKVIVVEDDKPYVFHTDLQSGPDESAPWRWLVYNVLAGYRHRLPVQTVAVLLSPRAQHPAINGFYSYTTPEGEVTFRYKVVKVWEAPVEQLLQGGLGTLPLAPISAIRPEEIASVIARIEARLTAETTPEHASELWVATRILLGLRHLPQFVDSLMKGPWNMEESTTYQEILHKGIARGRDEGRLREARQMLLRIAKGKFGPPDPAARAAIDAIGEIDRLESLGEAVLSASSWEELLRL